MFTWLKNLFLDEKAFVGLLRACLMGAGGAVVSGQLTLEGMPTWLGIVLLMAGGFVRSSTQGTAGVQKQ